MRKIITITLALILITFGGAILSKSIVKTNDSKSTVGGLSLLTGQHHKSTLAIEGMWCASCATGAEYNLKAIEGVVDAYVGFTNGLDGEGWVVYDKKNVTQDQIIEAVKPYRAKIVNDIVYKGD